MAEGVTVEASGMAPGSSLTSRDEALNRALRSAIEQGVGTLVDSETMVRNFKLLDDRIYSEVKGYVSSYKIIEDNVGEGDIYRIRVEAVVALTKLRKDIEALGIMLERKERPRTMVVFSELIDGLEYPGQVTQTEVERAFLKEKFPLIDKAQMEVIKERDAALSYEDPLKAAALGKRYGAEVVIVGQATSDLVDTSRPYGVSVYAYQAQTSAKAIKVDTASSMVSDSATSFQRGGGRIPTAKASLKDAGAKLAYAMMDQIAEVWRSEVYNVVGIQLVCDNATYELANLLEERLREMRPIQGVTARSLTGGVLILDLQMMGNTDMLAAKLTELTSPKVEIVGKTANRIDLKFLE